MKNLLTVPESAEKLGCSQQYIRQLIKDGRVEFERPGREYLVYSKSLKPFAKPGNRNPRKGNRND